MKLPMLAMAGTHLLIGEMIVKSLTARWERAVRNHHIARGIAASGEILAHKPDHELMELGLTEEEVRALRAELYAEMKSQSWG